MSAELSLGEATSAGALIHFAPPSEYEFAAAGLRTIVLPPGPVDVVFEMAAHTIDVNLNAGLNYHCWNSDRMKRHEMAADTVAVAPAGSTLKLDMLNSEEGLIIELEPERLTGLAAELFDDQPVDWRVIDYEPDPQLALLGRMAIAEIKRPWAGPAYVEALTVAIAARALARGAGIQLRPVPTRGHEARIVRAIEYAEARLSEPIGLTDMAAAACLSVFHFAAVSAQ